jgi:hypothetical protein
MYLGRVIISNLFLLSIKSYSLGYHGVASTTPNVKRHLKSARSTQVYNKPMDGKNKTRIMVFQ